MTPADARTAVDVIAHTLVRLEEHRAALRAHPPRDRHDGDEIDGMHAAIGAEVESIVAAGHAAELAGLGAAVARWRR